MNEATCSIYEKRPKICQIFPTCESDVKGCKSCGYSFKDGIRIGECNGCGECCINMPWPADATTLSCDILSYEVKDELSDFYKKDSVCRFLIKG